MPNWAISNVTIHSTDIEGLKHLNDVICTPQNYVTLPEDWGEDWIGSVLLGLGIGEGDTYDIASREFIVDCELHDKDLNLYIQSAWGLHYKGIKRMCETALDDYSITYTCEEPGCVYFVTNDSDWANRCYVWEDSEIEYFYKDYVEDLIPEWNKKYGKDWKTIQDIINDPDKEIYVFPFEYVPFNELSE